MDIIFFAAIAVFIFLKLREQLGKISDEEKSRIDSQIKVKKEVIIEAQNQITEIVTKVIEQRNQDEEKILGNLDENLKKTLLEIFQKCNISADFFINGVKSCFEMIIKSFADKDLNLLKSLLSEKIYAGFYNSIEQRNFDKKNLNSNIISIDKTEILSANIIENQASITVHIISKQINYFTDEANNIIDGRKDEISEINDIWTFKKDLESNNPNWILSTTA